MRIVTFFLALMLSLHSIAQTGAYQIITKGKKQGVISTDNNEWLVPLGKHQVVEPHENLFLAIDLKNHTVQGFYNQGWISKTTNKVNELFFRSPNGYGDHLSFEDGYVTVENEDFTIPKYEMIGYDYGQGGVGATFYGDQLLIASMADSIGLYNINVQDKKGQEMESFENVEFSIYNQILSVGRVKWKDYDPLYQTSYEVVSVEKYYLGTRGIEKRATIAEGSEVFSNELGYLAGYMYDSDGVLMDFETLVNSNYKGDSAAKYDLIYRTTAGILFVNENELGHISKEGRWTNTTGKYLDEYAYINEMNCTAAAERIGENIVVTSVTYGGDIILLDEDGNGIYDDNGDPVYQELEDVQKSGVWNIATKKWLVENKYSSVKIINNKIVAERLIFTTSEENQYEFDIESNIDIYDISGKLIKTLIEPGEETVLQLIYKGSEVREIEASYYMYEIINGEQAYIVDYSSGRIDYLYEVTTPNQGYIAGSFNPQTYSFISHQDNRFFLNRYDVEIGVTKREIKGNKGGFFNVFVPDYEYYENEFRDGTQALEIQEEPSSGIKRLGEALVVIYNNGFPSTYETTGEYDIYGDPFYEYDAMGNQIRVYSYEQKGFSNSGLWSASDSRWIIKPNYEDIIPVQGGYTAITKKDKVNGEVKTDEDEYTYIHTSDYPAVGSEYFVETFDDEYSVIQDQVEYNEFMLNLENVAHFSSEPGLESLVNYSFLVDEYIMIYDSYVDFWFKGKEGYSIVVRDGIKVHTTLSNMDWVYQSMEYDYGMRGDTLYVVDHYDPSNRIEIIPGDEIEIREMGNGIFAYGDLCYYVILQEEERGLIAHKTDEGKEEGELYCQIIKKGDELICQSPRIHEETYYIDPMDESFLDGDLYDFQESGYMIQYRNDFIWRKHQETWEIEYNANQIKNTPFGYFVDHNLIAQSYGFSEYFSDKKYQGGAMFLNKRLQQIEGLDVDNYYSCAELEGYSDYFVLSYGTKENNESTAFVSKSGEVVVKEACDYKVIDGVLEYTPCITDEFGGSYPELDDEGNQVIKKVSLK